MKKNSPIRIGFDFDKVFVNYPQFIPDALINRLYKKKGENLAYRFPGTIEQQIRILSHYHIFRTPISQNISVLKKIHHNGNETFLISSRFGFLKKRTEYWLRKYRLNKLFRELHFNYDNKQPHIFKDSVIKQLEITHYVDDDIDLLRYLAQKNPDKHFFWITKKKSVDNLPSNIIPISTLQELPLIKQKYD